MKGANATYWKNIKESYRSLTKGFKLAYKHLLEARQSRKPVGIDSPTYFDQKTGVVTLQYPYESLPVPDNARYRLHNEIDDCIVCDKCAKVCPVDCIEIEPIKSPEEIGKTSDGTSKRLYAAKFDIDMAKCCFCGLCTTVCPTECLTMTKAYDFSEFDVKDHNYAFAEMTPLEILEARERLEKAEAEKQASKQSEAAKATTSTASRPVFRSKVSNAKPQISQNPDNSDGSSKTDENTTLPQRPKIAIKPKFTKKTDQDGN